MNGAVTVTPKLIAMIINYHHHILKKKGHLYLDNVSNIAAEKKRWSVSNKLTLELAKEISKQVKIGNWALENVPKGNPHEHEKSYYVNKV